LRGPENQPTVSKLNVTELETSPSGNKAYFAEFNEEYIPVEERRRTEEHIIRNLKNGRFEIYIRIDSERIQQKGDTKFRHAKILFDDEKIPQFFLFGKEIEEAATNAVKDPLTGLDNREGWNIQLKKIAESIQRGDLNGKFLTLGFFDLNFLKSVNDTYGHSEGDKRLIEIAEHLKGEFRLNDEVARVGGDEFVVLAKSDISIKERLKKLLENQDGKDISYCAGLFEIETNDLRTRIRETQDKKGFETDLVYNALLGIQRKADELLFKAKEISKKNIVENKKPTVVVTN